MDINNTLAIVLAGGKGTRLHSQEHNLPKALRLAGGKPLLHWVLEALSFLPQDNIVIVDGYMADQVEAAFPGRKFALQAQQLGTGHAVMAAREYFQDFAGDVLVCFGDMPLLSTRVYQELLQAHQDSGYEATLLAGTSDFDLPYGRMLRNEDGSFQRIVEDRDCTPEQKQIKELNAGIMAVKAPWLLGSLSHLGTDNAQGEYYLTDVPYIIQSMGGKAGIFTTSLNEEILGVNTPEQLELVESYLRKR